MVNHCLENLLCVCQKCTVVGEVKLKDQLLNCLSSDEGATEIKHTSLGSETDVDTFGQIFLSLSRHHAENNEKE